MDRQETFSAYLPFLLRAHLAQNINVIFCFINVKIPDTMTK